MALPNCYRCGRQPCECKDGITLYHADCRDVLPLLEAGSVDLVLTDPPYRSLDIDVIRGTTTRLVGGNGAATRKGGKVGGEANWFGTLSDEDIASVLQTARRLMADRGAMYVFADVKTGLRLFPGLAPANVLVWDKGKIGMGYNWRRRHEWIAYCPGKAHKLRDAGKGDVLEYAGVSAKSHPTEKPVSLVSCLIANSTDRGQCVLDPFAGISTAIAAKRLGRRAIAVEIEARYCEISANRLRQEVLF
jgi:site-specific DNA-methyltransferase (adenine-specific)